MDKPRRSAKRVNYAVIANGDSDDEDFLPAICKKKRLKEYKENVTQSSPKLSPAEKKFKRVTETSILLPSNRKENENSKMSNSIKKDESMPGTSWGLTAKRHRKPVNSYNEGQSVSSDEFEGWEESSEESDFSTSSPIYNKRKDKKLKNSVKLKQVADHRIPSTDADLISLKEEKLLTKRDTVAENIKPETTLAGCVKSNISGERRVSSDVECKSDDKQWSSNKKVNANSSKANCSSPVEVTSPKVKQSSVSIEQLASPKLKQSSISVKQPASPKVKQVSVSVKQPSSPVLGKAKSISKQTSLKAKRPLVIASGKEPTELVKKQSVPNNSTNKLAHTTKSTLFKSPVIIGNRLTSTVATSSPKTGLRLGLSRKGAFKTLHPKASIS